MGFGDWAKKYSGYNIASDVVHGDFSKANQDMSANDVVGNALGLPHLGDPLKKGDTAAGYDAMNANYALAAQLDQQRKNYQGAQAPQIGSNGQVGVPGAVPAGAPPSSGGYVPPAAGNTDISRSGAAHFSGGTPAAPNGASGTPGAGGVGGGGGNYSNLSPNEQRQQQALDALTAAANGTTPSAAQIQTQQNLGQQLSNQYALASAMQGRNTGAALQAASRGASSAQSAAAGQGAVLRAQEQAQARDQLSQAIGAARGQDLQTNIANLNAKMQAMGYDTQTRNALLAAQLQAMGYSTSTANAIMQMTQQQANSQNQYNGQILGTGAKLLAA